MTKLSKSKISDSGGVCAAEDSDISDLHWEKLRGKDSEKEFLKKLKITKDNRKAVAEVKARGQR